MGVHGVENAHLVEFERAEDLGAEEFRAAAIVGQRHEAIEGVVVALERAVVGLERPEGQKDATGDAETAFNFVEGGGLSVSVAAACVHATLRDQATGEIGERDLKNALAAVGIEGALIEGGVAEEAVDAFLRMATLGGFRAEALHELPEITAALLGGGGGAEGEGKEQRGEETTHVKRPCV